LRPWRPWREDRTTGALTKQYSHSLLIKTIFRSPSPRENLFLPSPLMFNYE